MEIGIFGSVERNLEWNKFIIEHNVVKNGRFDNVSEWNLNAGWTIIGGKLVATSVVADTRATEFTILTLNETYKTIFTISDYVDGTVWLRLGNTLGTGRSGNGVFEEVLQCTSNENFYIWAVVGGSFKIDNVKVWTETEGYKDE